MSNLLLRRVSPPRSGAEGRDDDDVIGNVLDGHALVIGRIFKAGTGPAGSPWTWRMTWSEREDRGHEPTRAEACRLSGSAGTVTTLGANEDRALFPW
jgi:hypothetical protein